MSRRQEKIPHINPTAPTYVGIDVGKRMLDVFIYPHGCVMRIGNNEKAIRKLAGSLRNTRSTASRWRQRVSSIALRTRFCMKRVLLSRSSTRSAPGNSPIAWDGWQKPIRLMRSCWHGLGWLRLPGSFSRQIRGTESCRCQTRMLARARTLHLNWIFSLISAVLVMSWCLAWGVTHDFGSWFQWFVLILLSPGVRRFQALMIR